MDLALGIIDPGPCDDGADDDNGHGTHVAGSVLGDGTASSGSITGIAPEASILVHAIEQSGTRRYSRQPRDMFDAAVEMVVEFTPTRGVHATDRASFHRVITSAVLNWCYANRSRSQ